MKNFNLLLKICCFAVLAQLISCGKSKLSCSIRADKDYKIMKELISLRKEAAEVSKHIERLQSELQAFKEAETGKSISIILYKYLFFQFFRCACVCVCVCVCACVCFHTHNLHKHKITLSRSKTMTKLAGDNG